jgi:hypothetical protein
MPPKARKGPEAHASATPVGTIAKGNDGNKWVVTETANGVKRWVRQAAGTAKKGAKADVKVVPKKGSKEYLTHDNGGRSFLVRYNKSEFTVFEPVAEEEKAFYDDLESRRTGTLGEIIGYFTGNKWTAEYVKRQKALYTVPVMTSKYKRVFVGASHTIEIEDGKTPGGNTMLFEVDGGRYVCVSQDVASFKPPERIESYESPVHGSDVPYPYAVGAKACYLLLEGVTVPHSDLRSPDQDPYDVAYFGHVEHLSTRNKKATAYAKAHPLPGYKVIRERRF